METYEGMQISYDSSGYARVYCPTHPKSHTDGLIDVHILQAEKLLGRYLSDEEVVHHIDFNKCNNDLTNLMVFASAEMHARYHRSLQYGTDIELKRINNVWYCTEISVSAKEICPFCGRLKLKSAKRCKVCDIKTRRQNIPNRNVLISDLLSLNMTAIGKKYQVSDNAVRKWCQYYNLPYKRKDVLSYRVSHK